MALKKATALNKSQAIRQALSQHSNKAPGEIARLLTEQHGVPFSPKKVSSIKSQLNKQKRPARKPAARVAARRTAAARPTSSRSPVQAATGGVAAVVTNLQSYIKRLGKADLHRLIDTL